MAELRSKDRLLALEATGFTTMSAALQNDLGAMYTESPVAEGPFMVMICHSAALQSLVTPMASVEESETS